MPDYDGKRQVSGINGIIEIYWDKAVLPHIFVDSQNDLAFCMGYVMAQGQLWRMALFRRVAAGRLSEVFGEKTLKEDRFARVIGL